MNKTDYSKFTAEMNKTAEAFGAEVTPGRVAAYFEELSDLSLEAVIGALTYARRTLTFFPKIAELRRYAEGSVDDRAELGWRTLVDLVKFEGAYPSLYVYDGAIGYAIECLGGWLTACAKLNEASPEMVANYEKHFKNSYKLGAMRDEGPRYLVGQVESDNRALGAWKSPTVDQPVCLVRPGQVVKVVMPFSLADGRLTGEARAALTAGGNDLRRYLPLPVPVAAPLLPPADAELATDEEVNQILGAIKSMARGQRPSNVISIAERKSAAD